MNIFLPIILNVAVIITPVATEAAITSHEIFEDGSGHITVSATEYPVCINEVFNQCADDTDATPYTFYEDGSVRFTLPNNQYASLCLANPSWNDYICK